MPAHMDELAIRLGERVKAFIRDVQTDSFEALALSVFEHQYARNGAYRRFCSSRSASPDSVSTWREIPAVPAEAFKLTALTCHEAQLLFRTSGTRKGRSERGVHHVPDPELYQLSVSESFRRFVLPDRERIRILSLIPSLEEQPDSSLSYMASQVLDRFGDQSSHTFVAQQRILLGALFSALDRATVERTPVLLFGTTLALSAVLDAAQEVELRWALTSASRLVDTGGAKSVSREIDDDTLLARYGERFGLSAHACANEYGMTEMLSQLYSVDLERQASSGWSDSPAGLVDRRIKVGPHWTRARIVDPDSLDDADEGLFVHVDLANVHSVAAILTEDLGLRTDSGLALVGRRLGAEARGCSIAMDEWLA